MESIVDVETVAARLSRSYTPKVLVGMGEPMSKLSAFLSLSLSTPSSSSLTLCGPSGSGKSVLLTRCIRNARKLHPPFKFVKLDGKISHTLSECYGSLCSQLGVDTPRTLDSGSGSKPVSSTVLPPRSFRSNGYSASLKMWEDAGAVLNADSTPLVIVLENVEAFAGKGKQTFLYSLLDKVHSRERRYCVIMTTGRLNVGEMLERRIRSRSEIVSIFVGRIGVEECVDVVAERIKGWRGKTKEDIINFMRGERNGGKISRAWSLGRGVGWFLGVARLWVGWTEKGMEEGPALDKSLSMMGHNMVVHGLPPSSHVGNLRLLTLSNCTQHQIVFLVAGWKVEERNLRREDYVNGVTFTDVENEIKDYSRTKSNISQGQFPSSEVALFNAFTGLLELGIVKFADRHLGGAPLLYGGWREVRGGEYEAVKGRRLHIVVDWREEGKEWIRRGERVNTVVREWALKG